MKSSEKDSILTAIMTFVKLLKMKLGFKENVKLVEEKTNEAQTRKSSGQNTVVRKSVE